MGCLIYLIVLIPLGIAGAALNYSVKGGKRRLVGILACPVLGGAAVGIGYWATFVGMEEWVVEGEYWVLYKTTWPIAGWIGIVLGGLCLVFGTIVAAAGGSEITED